MESSMHDGDSTSPAPTTLPAPADPSRSLRTVWLIVLGALLFRVLYLVLFCRYELVEDEAQYWLWSKHLDWSYYTKGPGVAWAIWLSTQFLGDGEWAVRMPTAIASAIGALAVGALARDLAAEARERAIAEEESVFDWATPARVGALSALAYVLTPALQVAGIVMTIDGSYVACWAVACWAFWRAIHARPADPHSPREDPYAGWHWIVVGAAIGLGFLFKYTMLLLVPGLLAFLVLRPREPGQPRRVLPKGRPLAWFVGGVLLALLGLAPVVIWNQQHGWPTIAHLLGHLGVQGGDVPVAPEEKKHWSPWWLPELIGQQLGMIGPWLILAVLAWTATRPGVTWFDDPRRAGRRFLVCAAAPILIFYTIVALIAEPEGNWPMAAYVTLLPLAAWGAADALAHREALARGTAVDLKVRWRIVLWRVGFWYAVVAAIPVHALDRVGDAALVMNRQSWFQWVFKKATDREPRDPAGRVRGGRAMALHVAELLKGLETRTTKEGFVLCQHYGRASQIAYYIPARFTPSVGGTDAGSYTNRRKDKPLVLCAMQETGGRRSQFDFWEDTKLNQIALMNHPAVVVSSTKPEIYWAFKRMFDVLEELPGGQRLRGESKPDRSAYLGFEYKGTAAAVDATGRGVPLPSETQPK